MVETLKEPPVKERGGLFEQVDEGLGRLKSFLVTKEGSSVLVLSLFAKFSLAVGLVEGGEEEILEDGLVVVSVSGLGIESFEYRALEIERVKKCVWNETALFDEPNKEYSRQEADKIFSLMLSDLGSVFEEKIFVRLFVEEREMAMLHRPEIPAGKFAIKTLI